MRGLGLSDHHARALSTSVTQLPPQPAMSHPPLAAVISAIDSLHPSSLGSLLRASPGLASERDEDDQPLLIRALFASDPHKPEESLALIEALLSAGASPEDADGDGSSSLHVAASKLTIEPQFAAEALEALLARLDMNPDELIDAEGDTPLAAVIGRVRAAGGTLAPEGEAALVHAAQLLVERGCGVLGRAARGRGSPPASAPTGAAEEVAGGEAGGEAVAATLLHEAAEWAPVELLNALLLADDIEAAMATADVHGDGPMQVALAKGRPAVASAMLSGFPQAAEGPWEGGYLPAAERTLAFALHRMIAGAVRSPPKSAALQKSSDLAACARLLVERHGAPVDGRDRNGRTPLAAALATSAPTALVTFLLRHDALPEEVDVDGRCPLMLAAANGDAKAVAQLLEAAANARAGTAGNGVVAPRILAVDRTGRSALMHAAAARSAEAAATLLQAGADAQTIDEDGRCAMLLALVGPAERAGFRGAAAATATAAANDASLPKLLTALASPPQAACVSLIRRAEAAEALAAELAASKGGGAGGAAKVAAAIPDGLAVSAGGVAAALMAAVCSVHGECAISVAASLENAAAFDALSSALDAAGVGLASSGGMPLIAASAAGDARAVARLLSKDGRKRMLHQSSCAPQNLPQLGCRLSAGVLDAAAASVPASAALAAASRGHADVMRALLAHDPSVGTAALSLPRAESGGGDVGKGLGGALGGGATPLMAAAAAGAVDCVTLLLGHGKGVAAATDDAGRSALMHAASGRSRECIAALLSAGSNATAVDAEGRTPLAHAAAGGDVGCIEALYAAAPSSLHAMASSGATPLLECAAGAHADAIELLSSYGASIENALELALRAAPAVAQHAQRAAATDAPADTAPRLAWSASVRLAAVESLARAIGSGMLLWKALRLGAPADLIELLLGSLARSGSLAGEAAHRASGRGLLHTAVLMVADGRLSNEHVIALARGLPERELLAADIDELTAIGLATERGLEALGLALESTVLIRLQVLVELVYAPAHQQHATRLAEQIHSYWPQLEVRTHAHRSAKDTPRVSPFDVLWAERCGNSRRSAVLYTHYGKGEGPLPGERALWREISLKIDGKLVLSL